MKTVAYLRVSTPQQNVSSQRLVILEYARAHDIRIDDFIEATASGQASEKRRRLSGGGRLDEVVDADVVRPRVLEDGEALAAHVLLRGRDAQIGDGLHGLSVECGFGYCI